MAKAKELVTKGPLKVRATMKGFYNGKMYYEGDVFVLVDQKDAKTGKLLQPAQAVHDENGTQIHRGAFAERGTQGGWMERVVAEEEVAPEVQNSRDIEEAQRIADAETSRIASMSDEEKVAAAHGAEVVPTTKRGLPTAAPQGGGMEAL